MSSHAPEGPPSRVGALGDASPTYEMVRLLGVGGMAEVFLAHKLTPGGGFKPIAFKRILPHFTKDAGRVAKFLDETATAAALVHPHIVGIHHWGTYEGDYFVEMELVRGITLKEYMEALAGPDGQDGQFGPVPALEVALIGAMVADALHYAHTFTRGQVTGFVHRDVSPDNIMISLHGLAKLLDFGIAKALKGADRLASKTNTSAGKPYYHPPEQWHGKVQLDARADLYAIGMTLAVALCGRQLFESRGENWNFMVYRVIQGDRPDVADIAPPDAPADLVSLLEGLIHADREHRHPATAKELSRAFKAIARRLGGDLDLAKEKLAARVAEHYRGDSDTHQTLEPPKFSQSSPSRSARRLIDPETRADRPPTPKTAPMDPASGHARTAALPDLTPQAPASDTPAPGSSRRSLVLALAVSLTVLFGLLAGVGGFALAGLSGGDGASRPPADPSSTDDGSSEEPEHETPHDSVPTPTSEATAATESPSPPASDGDPVSHSEADQPPMAAPEAEEEAEPPEEPAAPGRVQIIAIPEGHIQVDGRSRGQSPVTVSLSPGSHTIVARNPDGRTARRRVRVRSGRTIELQITYP